ncbi:hypothetical protein LCGC14_1261090 [marine sediment metagenome]|uniref:Uncharacterized protein n=1 Tax=marine sediment metagenome TaxID=412755 RepID=A0A0F9LLV8_9ZZZZ
MNKKSCKNCEYGTSGNTSFPLGDTFRKLSESQQPISVHHSGGGLVVSRDKLERVLEAFLQSGACNDYIRTIL